MLVTVSLWSQAPLLFSSRLNVTNVTGSDPYTLTGVVQDELSLWSAADINAANDSIYHLEGSDLLIYRITSISSAIGNNFTIIVDDIMNSGILPSTGTEWAAIEFTVNSQFPSYIGNLSSPFKAVIDNRFKQRLDELLSPDCLTKTITQTAHGLTLGQPVAVRAGVLVGAAINSLIPAEAIVTQVVTANQVVIGYSGECDATAHGFTVDSAYYTPRIAGSPIINASRPDTVQFIFRPSTSGKLVINIGEMFIESSSGSSNGMQAVQTISTTGAPTVTTGYTIIPIKATSASGAVDVQINPATTGVNYRIVATNTTNTLRVVPSSGTISGMSSYTFSVASESISVISDGTNLYIW